MDQVSSDTKEWIESMEGASREDVSYAAYEWACAKPSLSTVNAADRHAKEVLSREFYLAFHHGLIEGYES